MNMKSKLAVICALLFLAGCKPKPMLVPVGDASSVKSSETVHIREGTMLLRGLDNQKFDISKIPNPYSDFVFVASPGSHVLWLKNVQTGNIISPENLRCYRVIAELRPGVHYIVDEDREKHIALLKKEGTGEVIATGIKIDEKAAYSDECNW